MGTQSDLPQSIVEIAVCLCFKEGRSGCATVQRIQKETGGGERKFLKIQVMFLMVLRPQYSQVEVGGLETLVGKGKAHSILFEKPLKIPRNFLKFLDISVAFIGLFTIPLNSCAPRATFLKG